MATEVRIPDAPDDQEIEVIEVLVAAGAQVGAGDALLEVATDKANVEVTAPVAGTVAELKVAEGDILEATAVLLIIEEAS